MKRILSLTILIAGLYAASMTAQAQTIIWGSAQAMTGDADILTNGTYVDAAFFGGSKITDDTVTFNPITSGHTSLGFISIQSDGSVNYGGSALFSSASPSSTTYSNLVSTIGYTHYNAAAPAPLVTLSGLTIGDTYQVEVWAFDGKDSSTAVGTHLTGTTPVMFNNTAAGQYSIGTFTATSGVETFAYAANTGASFEVISDVSLRDLGSTPEPTTLALFATAVSGLALQLNRRRRSTL